MVKGMGGAMDLVNGSDQVTVLMTHTIKGNSKIKKECSLPLTGVECVDQIITDLAVFEIVDEQLVLTEHAEGHDVDEIQDKTEASFEVSSELKTISLT
jgi:3-oxoacid CoA-transferase subunit B